MDVSIFRRDATPKFASRGGFETTSKHSDESEKSARYNSQSLSSELLNALYEPFRLRKSLNFRTKSTAEIIECLYCAIKRGFQIFVHLSATFRQQFDVLDKAG